MSTKTILDPFATPATRRLSLAVRHPQTRAVVADERQLTADFVSADPAKRARAIRHLNAVAAAAMQVVLSSPANFPDEAGPGVATRIRFGEADRNTADVRWRALFDVRDLTAQAHPFFEITDVYDSLQFEEYELNERIKVGSVRADTEIFKTPVVAAGIQYNRFWSNWQTIWNTEEGLASMNAKWFRRMARRAYQVLTAAGLTVISYDATGGTQLEKDINTINNGITAIGNAVYQTETGFENVTSEEDIEGLAIYLLYNPGTAGYRNRVNRALGARLELPNDNNSAREVDVPLIPLPTRDVPANGWFPVLAGRKNVTAVTHNLEVFDLTDPRVAGVADAKIGQGAYQHVRGDARQGVQLATS